MAYGDGVKVHSKQHSNSATGKWAIIFIQRPFYPRGKSRVPFTELGGHQSRSERFGEERNL